MVWSGIELDENLDLKIDQLIEDAFAALHPLKTFVAGDTSIPVTGHDYVPYLESHILLEILF